MHTLLLLLRPQSQLKIKKERDTEDKKAVEVPFVYYPLADHSGHIAFQKSQPIPVKSQTFSIVCIKIPINLHLVVAAHSSDTMIYYVG